MRVGLTTGCVQESSMKMGLSVGVGVFRQKLWQGRFCSGFDSFLLCSKDSPLSSPAWLQLVRENTGPGFQRHM